jgi:hypothetical protein
MTTKHRPGTISLQYARANRYRPNPRLRDAIERGKAPVVDEEMRRMGQELVILRREIAVLEIRIGLLEWRLAGADAVAEEREV